MLMDRVGAAKSTGLSFLLLGLYPIGLIFADDADSLWWVSLYYGLSHCGASVGWMLGPVSFAPSPDKVPQYVAIHATFVGIRGKLFQALGVFLYELTHDFTIPFIVAALSFVWSAWQMFALDRRMRPKPESKPPDPSKDQTNEGSGGS
jgi:MFS family permease